MTSDNKQHTLVIRYDGEINSELCQGLTLAVHSQMSWLEPDLLTRKRITHIIAECLLNLSHHAEASCEMPQGGKYVHILVECNEYHYVVSTRNLVSNQKIKQLTTKLQKINGMDSTELYDYYMQQLQTGSYTGKGTAGLGFIDMARKSGHRLHYDFSRVNHTHMHFHFAITVDKPKAKR